MKGPSGRPLWDEIKGIRNDMTTKDYREGQDKIQAIMDKADAEGRIGLTADEMNQVTRLNFYGALNETNEGDVNYLTGAARDLMSIRKKGSTDAAAGRMIKQEQDAFNVQNEMNVLTGNGKKPVITDPEIADYLKDGFWKNLRGAILDWPMSSSPASHMDVLSMHDKTSGPNDSFLSRVILGSQVEANRNNFVDNEEVKDIKLAKMAEIYGLSRRALAKDAVDRTKIQNIIKYKDIMGKDQELPMTRNQAIYRYMQLQDPRLAKSMETMGYMHNGELTDKANKTIDLLTPEDKKWGDYYLNDFYPMMYDKLNPTYRRLYGRDMPFEPNYSPSWVQGGKGDPNDDDLLSRQNFTNSVKNRSLIARVDHCKALRLMDADQVGSSYQHGMLYWNNYSDATDLLSKFVNNPDIRYAIKQNFTNGDQHLNALQMDLDRMMKKPDDSWKLAKVIRTVKNNVLLGILSANLPVGLKDLTSIPAFANYMPLAEIPKYALQSAFKWTGDMGDASIIKKIWNDPYMQQRVKKGWDVNIDEVLAAGQHNVDEKNDWRRQLMFSSKYGHVAAIMIGGVVYVPTV